MTWLTRWTGLAGAQHILCAQQPLTNTTPMSTPEKERARCCLMAHLAFKRLWVPTLAQVCQTLVVSNAGVGVRVCVIPPVILSNSPSWL